jgi:hypothetical protein
MSDMSHEKKYRESVECCWCNLTVYARDCKPIEEFEGDGPIKELVKYRKCNRCKKKIELCYWE